MPERAFSIRKDFVQKKYKGVRTPVYKEGSDSDGKGKVVLYGSICESVFKGSIRDGRMIIAKL